MKKITFLVSLSLCLAALAGCVKENDAQTEPVEGTRAVYDLPGGDWWDYSETNYPGAVNFKFFFTNIDQTTGTGMEIGLDFAFNPSLVDNSLSVFTMPVPASSMYMLGAYDPNDVPVDGLVVLGADTYAAEFVDGNLLSYDAITGGYVMVFPSMTEGQLDMIAQLDFGGTTHTVNHTGYMMYDHPGYDGFGYYDVVGTPWFPAVAPLETWESQIGMIGVAGIHGVTNPFNWTGFLHYVLGTTTGDLWFDMWYTIDTDTTNNVDLTGGCLIFQDDAPFAWLDPESIIELEWDANRETLSFPTTLPIIVDIDPVTEEPIVEEMEVVFGIVGRDPVTRNVQYYYGQLYYGVVLTEQPAPPVAPAMLPAPAGVMSFAQYSSMMAPATRAQAQYSVANLTPVMAPVTRTAVMAK